MAERLSRQELEIEGRKASRFRVGAAHAGFRLDQFLQRMIPKLSRNRIQKAIDERVRLSWDAPVKASTPVREGGEVYVDDPEVNEGHIDFDPPILHEDEDLLAIDKPPGLVVHPTHSHLHNTVITLLRRLRDEPGLTLAHRLDAETSGVLLFGRHRQAARRIQTSFERGRVDKRYRAIVFGEPRHERFTIDEPLGPISRDSFVFRQWPGGEDAREARTHFEVLERLGEFALVAAELDTGRRHQIRAHLAFAGHPLVGDRLYVLDDAAYRRQLRRGALDEAELERLRAPRTLLHSAYLALPHPRDASREVVVEAALPADMRAFLERCRAGEEPGSSG